MRKLIRIISSLFTFFLLTFFFLSLNSYANGPLVVENGMAITYGTMSFVYRYDKGKLGKFTNAEAIAIFEDLYDDWELVKTTTIKFKQDTVGSLNSDIDATNFRPILETEDLLGFTPIVFDEDGSLTEALLGKSAGSNVLGFSGPRIGEGLSTIPESQAVFNGKFINGIDSSSDPETTEDSFKGTIIHETGHGIGLDHAQINVEAIKPSAGQSLRDSVPLMFPVAVNDLFVLRQDDISGVSFLYPNTTELMNFGSIEGKVFRQDGTTPILGANVIARNINNDPTLAATSCVSDFLANHTGSYNLFALPPGDYRIEIEPIDIMFVGGSGVGPYTGSQIDQSFINPVQKGYYTGPNKLISPNESDALIVSIAAGQSIKDANIISSTSVVSGSSSSSSSGDTPDQNEIEPNETVDQAQFLTLPSVITGMAQEGDLSDIEVTAEDGSRLFIHDLYKFNFGQTDLLNAHLINESINKENDLDLILFDANADNVLDSSTNGENTEELINKLLQPGTYLLGVTAFMGSANYILDVSNSGAPSVSILAPGQVTLSKTGASRFNLTIQAFNFTDKSKCKIIKSHPMLLKNKVNKFNLSPTKTLKTIAFKIPLVQALKLISSSSEETATISVFCTNGANDETDILLTPAP